MKSKNSSTQGKGGAFAVSCCVGWAGLLWAGGLSLSAATPPGLLDVAGKLAHNHWQVLGPDKREALETWNRELRESDRLQQSGPTPEARQEAQQQVDRLARALVESLESSPHLIRLHLRGEPPHWEPGVPVEQPGRTGVLLMKIQGAEEDGVTPLHFSAIEADLSVPPGESSLVGIDAASAGVTYALIGLENLPVGRTTLMVELRRPGVPALKLTLDVVTPPPGRLKLTVLSDDDGQPAPAMVRLMWRTDGLARRPGNGIEFATQFDNQGRATGARAANLPGSLGEHFWCVPGPVDMALSPGVWQIGVRRGVEHEAVFRDITIHAGAVAEETLRPKRWTDMRKLGWWSGDDHVHARLLTGEDAEHLLAWIKAEGVHLANVVKMGDIYRTYFEQRGFGDAFQVRDGDYVLCPGQECPRTHDQMGHTLAMNIQAMVRDTDRYFLYDTVFDAVHAQGGLSGYAHVNSGLFHVHRDMSLNVPQQKVDFVEILQFNRLGTDLYYEFLNLGCKLTASAGSDVPWGGTIGEVRTYAYLGEEPFSASAWFDSFAKGRTFTTSGPMLDLRVDEAMPGDEIVVDQDRPVHVRARAWADPQRMGPVRLQIVRHGEVLQEVESSDPARPEVSLELDALAGDGCWIAARVAAGDGTSAHTSPVYVVREGLRFWKHDAVESLLAKRLESLQEIKAIVESARATVAEDKTGGDYAVRQLALQGPALLERVVAAEQMYAELQHIAAQEKAKRASAEVPVP